MPVSIDFIKMPSKVKAYELQSKCACISHICHTILNNLNCRSKNDLSKQLSELKNELLTLRVQKIAGGSAAKLTRM